MPVPFFDIRYSLGAADKAAILERWSAILDHGRFIMGPEIGELEAQLAEFLGVRRVVSCSNGSDALVLALRVAGVVPGDEVVVPAFTFFATAGAVVRLGAKPVFADIDARSFNLDPESVARHCNAKTRAVVPVHLFGLPAPMQALREAAGHAHIVEDAAQAIGAVSPEGTCGAMSEVASFSCFPTKNLGALGDAGFISTNDEKRANHAQRLRQHGGGKKYHHEEVGYNFRMDSLQAAALLQRLPHLLEWNAARMESARHYGELVRQAGLEDRVILPQHAAGHIYHQYVIRTGNRDAVKAGLAERGIGTAVYYPEPLHLQPCFADLGGKPGDLPETERATAEALALPIHPGLTAADREEVVAGLAALCAEPAISK